MNQQKLSLSSGFHFHFSISKRRTGQNLLKLTTDTHLNDQNALWREIGMIFLVLKLSCLTSVVIVLKRNFCFATYEKLATKQRMTMRTKTRRNLIKDVVCLIF